MHAISIRYFTITERSLMNGFQDRIRNSVRTTERIICSNPNGTAFIGVENRPHKRPSTSRGLESPVSSAPHPPVETTPMESRPGSSRPSSQTHHHSDHTRPRPSASPPSASFSETSAASNQPSPSAPLPPSFTGDRPWYQKVPKWAWWVSGILLVALIVLQWVTASSSGRTETFQNEPTVPDSNDDTTTETTKPHKHETISLPYDKLYDDWNPIVKKNIF